MRFPACTRRLALCLILFAGPVVRAGDARALARVLQDPAQDTNAKGQACLELMELGPAAAPAVPALVAQLNSPEEILRDYAITTLSKIGPAASAALPALRKTAAADPSADIRGLARDAIARIGPPGAEPAVAAEAPLTRDASPSGPSPRRGAARPPLAMHEGSYFRWAAPLGWSESETTNGVTLTAPDGVAGVSSVLLMRAPGRAAPADFALRMLSLVPGTAGVRVVATHDLPDQPSGYGTPWKVQDLDVTYAVRGVPVRSRWTVGIVGDWGTFDAFMLGYQAPAAEFDSAQFWLASVARSVEVTNPGQVAGNDRVLTPRNHPLDNSALLESWRQKGLSEDRISQARREGTMGYERARDPSTGRVYEMPLESWDATAGGYRNPAHPDEILQRAAPGE